MNYPMLAPTLRANSFFPAPLVNGRPAGAYGVAQPNYSQGNYSGAGAAVLTAVRPPRGRFAGVVLKPQETFLATLTVSVSPEWSGDVDAILAKYVGAAKCPTRTDADGKVLRVFRYTDSAPCTTLSTERWPDFARIDCKDSFIPLDGAWTGSLLDTPRSELAALDQSSARALLAEINSYLSAQQPVVERKVTPQPPVAWDGRYSNERAIARLEANGFGPAELAKDSVGIQLAPDVVAVAVRSPLPEIHALVSSKYEGGKLVRVEADGQRVYVFAGTPFKVDPWGRSQMRKGMWVPGTRTSIEFQSKGALALSGRDDSNSAYWLEGSPILDVRHAELPQISHGAALQLLQDVERLLGVL